MSKGLGRIELTILEYFISAAPRKVADVKTLCARIYGSLWFDAPGYAVTRRHEVALRRALKRLKAKGYPLELIRFHGGFRGRPQMVLWRGDNRQWHILYEKQGIRVRRTPARKRPLDARAAAPALFTRRRNQTR